jgi:hypothetical protein
MTAELRRITVRETSAGLEAPAVWRVDAARGLVTAEQ